MAESIERGKQQILFNYLPGRVFDFGKSTVAMISKVSGAVVSDLNSKLILRKIAEDASVWDEQYRPTLRNDILYDESRFILLDPNFVEAEIFPLVFWCSNNACKKVYDYTSTRNIPSNRSCPRCKTGRLSQLRFVKVHRCGHIEPLTPTPCKNCHSQDIALDARESERISGFRLRCLSCGNKWPVFTSKCKRCNWPDKSLQDMDIEVFRAGRTFYIHWAMLINIPQRDYNKFFSLPEWYAISKARFLNLGPLASHTVSAYSLIVSSPSSGTGFSEVLFGELFEKLKSGVISTKEFSDEVERLRSKANPSNDELITEIEKQSGVGREIWEQSKFNILDSVIPYEVGNKKELSDIRTSQVANDIGIKSITLIDNFPIIIASYGFSRVSYNPNDCYLNSFPPDLRQNGRHPILIDKVQADAILFRLDPAKILHWLKLNNFEFEIPAGSNEACAQQGYFVSLFNNVNIYEKIFNDNPICRVVLGLLHTYSHLAIRQATLLCGLEKTSISEYIIPKTLSFALY